MLRRKLAGVLAGAVVSMLAFLTAVVPSARAATAEQFMQDFEPAFALLREMGLPDAKGGEYGVLNDPNNYSGRDQLFYNLELQGGKWRLPGDRLLGFDGAVSDLPKTQGVEWKKADLAADVAAVLKFLKAAEKGGYEDISYRGEQLAQLIVFGSQLFDQGMKNEANQLVAHALAASRNPRDPIRQALLSLANGAYRELLAEHLPTADWSGLAEGLVPLRERFGSAWDDSAAVDLLIAKLREQGASGAASVGRPVAPEGVALPEADLKFLEELSTATAAGFAELAKPDENAAASDPDAEDEEMASNPALLVQGIQGLFGSKPWWSSEEIPEGEADADDENYEDEEYAMASAVAGLNLPSMDKWRELADRRFEALPVLLAMAIDERFLPATATALRYGGYYDGYQGGMWSGYSSSGDELSAEQRYAQMERPVTLAELAELLLRRMLPGAPVADEDSADPERQRAALLAWGADFYLRLKDQPEVMITREMFENGAGNQALMLLCRQGGPEDFAAIEEGLLDGLAGGQNADLGSIYQYLKVRGDEGSAFYELVSAEGKRQLAALSKDDWQHEQMKASLQRLDALYSTETAQEVLARVLAEDSEESLDDVSGLLYETLGRETRDVALKTLLDTMVAHKDAKTRIGLLELVGNMSRMEFGEKAGELSAPSVFGAQWLELLNDDRSAGEDSGAPAMTIGDSAAWMFVNLHEPDQIPSVHRLWETIGENSLKYLRQRAIAISSEQEPPDFPDASTVDAKRIAELEGKLLAASGLAMQKVWDEMSFSESLAMRERLADTENPPQALLDHLAGQIWQIIDVKFPETVAKLIGDGGDSPATQAWNKVAALKGANLDHASLTSLFTDLLPVASHRLGAESWRVDLSGGSGSGGIVVEVSEIDTEALVAAAEVDQMLGFMVNRGVGGPAAMLTVSSDELGGGIWLAPLADTATGKVPETTESEMGGDMLPASYFDNNRPQWVKQIESLFDPETSGDPSFSFSLRIFLTTSDAIEAAEEE